MMRCNIFYCHVIKSSTCGLLITSSDALSLSWRRFVRVWPSNCIQKHISLLCPFCFPNVKLYFKAFSGIKKVWFFTQNHVNVICHLSDKCLCSYYWHKLLKEPTQTTTRNNNYWSALCTCFSDSRHLSISQTKKVTRRTNLLFSNHCKAWR